MEIRAINIQSKVTMKIKQILISWIGYADLQSVAESTISNIKRNLPKNSQASFDKSNDGPIQTLLKAKEFDEVHLLTNFPRTIIKKYIQVLDTAVIPHFVKLKNPIDYEEVFIVSDETLQDIISEQKSSSYELNIHLSSGTPAMAAVWVLLGKTKYPAKFYQTYANKVCVTNIPFDISVDFVPKLLQDSDLRFQHLAAKSPQEIEGFDEIIGDSKAIRIAVGRAAKAAFRDVPVLITGPTGSGKEMFARAIHFASKRKNKPFVVVNCAAIPSQLLESELFGHKKGAFTGADKDRAGAFETADGGTLFLDEIGECNKMMQAKLLRVLQSPPNNPPTIRVFKKVGSDKDIISDVRIIAATNKELPKAVTKGNFREDLFYRLAVITISLPSLSERKEDIVPIAEHLLSGINAQFRNNEPGYKNKKISVSTKKFIKSQPWPGNIRQLYNVLLQAAVMSEDDLIHKEDILIAIGSTSLSTKREQKSVEIPNKKFNLNDYLNSLKYKYLSQAMRQCNGSKTKAAKLLGFKNYQTLDAQLKKLNVKWESNEY